MLNNISIDDFKEYFFRDFSFLPIYSPADLYSVGDVVFNENNNNFYQSLDSSIFTTLDSSIFAVSDNSWKRISDKILNYITDADIEKSFKQAYINFNPDFFLDDESLKIAYLYLSAFFLVSDIQASSLGIGSTFQGFTTSKSVGDVSEGYTIPEWITNSPILGVYTTNAYGRKYLNIIAPYLVGNIMLSPGGTTIG